MLITATPPARANDHAGRHWVGIKARGDGVALNATRRLVDRIRQESRGGRATTQWAVTPACPGNDPNIGGPYDVACGFLVTACRAKGEGDGPMTWVWRRPLSPLGRWVQVGYSCSQKLPKQPGMSMADVRRAFRQVDFAKPRLASQPGGGWTLVNLDTYYLVQWPKAGVRPGQVVTVRLLGHRVKIRPRIDTYLYDYGDGQTLRTTDPGAPYPNGRITHAYQHTGDVRVAVTARYTADFAIDHGPYRALDDTIDLTSPTRTITIYEARAHLIPNPRRRLTARSRTADRQVDQLCRGL